VWKSIQQCMVHYLSYRLQTQAEFLTYMYSSAIFLQSSDQSEEIYLNHTTCFSRLVDEKTRPLPLRVHGQKSSWCTTSFPQRFVSDHLLLRLVSREQKLSSLVIVCYYCIFSQGNKILKGGGGHYCGRHCLWVYQCL